MRLKQFIAACIAALPLAAAEPAMPRVIREVDAGVERILFVSADEALSPTGTLRPELFPHLSFQLVTKLLARPTTNGCIEDQEHFVDYVNLPPRDSIASFSASAAYVVEGIVSGREYGFHYDEPGQLLRLESLTTLRGTPPQTQRLYTFLPIGRFNVGPHTICKTDWRYTAAPEFGEHVIAFILPHFTYGEFADILDETAVIVIRRDGTLSLPSAFNEAADAPRTADALRAQIRAR